MNTIEAADTESLGRVAAVVVAYFPDANLADRFANLLAQVDRLFLIDNGGLAEGSPVSGWEVIRNPGNLGVAAAFNQGMRLALAAGCNWLLALDQDASPTPDMVAHLRQAAREHPDPVHLAIVASHIEDPEVSIRARFLRRRFGPVFERADCVGGRLDDVSLAISAGSLYRLDVLSELGSFREDFFIDYVDTEYCLRAQAHGYRIAVACKAVLHHRLGARKHASLAGLDFYPTFHSPERWYYIARNRIPMIRMYALKFPYWFTYEVVASTYGLMRMLLFEDRRGEKLRAVMKGTLDGLLGRLGPGPLGTPARPS